MRAPLRIFCSLCFVLATACASPPAPAPDEGVIARAVLEAQAEAARIAAATAATADQPAPEATPETPIWAPTERGLKHIASGYTCPKEAAGFKRIGQDVFAGLGTGHDVACVYQAPDLTRVKLHLTNFNRAVSPSAHLKGVETTIRDGDTAARPTSAPSVDIPINQAAAFERAPTNAINDPGHTRTAVWIDAYGLWHVKARASYTPETAPQVAKLVNRLFVRARENLARGNTAP